MESDSDLENAGEELEENTIDSPTEGRRVEGEANNEPPTRRRRVVDEPEPEDQEELLSEQVEIMNNGIRVLEFASLARPGEIYTYKFVGGIFELRYRARGEWHEQENERIRSNLQLWLVEHTLGAT